LPGQSKKKKEKWWPGKDMLSMTAKRVETLSWLTMGRETHEKPEDRAIKPCKKSELIAFGEGVEGTRGKKPLHKNLWGKISGTWDGRPLTENTIRYKKSPKGNGKN